MVGNSFFAQEGHSVLANVHDFLPYFYIAVPRGFTEADIGSFMVQLNVRSFRAKHVGFRDLIAMPPDTNS